MARTVDAKCCQASILTTDFKVVTHFFSCLKCPKSTLQVTTTDIWLFSIFLFHMNKASDTVYSLKPAKGQLNSF